MKIWVDDIRKAPKGYTWCKSVNETIHTIEEYEESIENILDEYDFPPIDLWTMGIDIIDLDHDAGKFVKDGGDYIKILDWMEASGRNYPIRIHSMNPVGIKNMRAIIQKNNWKEVK